MTNASIITDNDLDRVFGAKQGDPIVTDCGGGITVVTFEGRGEIEVCVPKQCIHIPNPGR